MKKFLIVYYSRTGVSKAAAERAYELAGGDKTADIEEIVDLKDRSGFFGALVSLKDSISDNITNVDTVKHMPSDYLEVIVVTPIWCGKVADAVRTYLAAYKSDVRSLKIVACGGSDSPEQGAQIQKSVLRNFAIKTKTLITLKKKDVLSGNVDSRLISLFQENNE